MSGWTPKNVNNLLSTKEHILVILRGTCSWSEFIPTEEEMQVIQNV
jgi:hypothetical protein